MSSLSLTTPSSPLRTAANLKIENLRRLKAHIEENIIPTLNRTYDRHETKESILARLSDLLACFEPDPDRIINDEFATWTRCVEQAQNDRFITSETLVNVEKEIHRELEQVRNRLVMSEYFVVLVENALHTLEGHKDVGPELNKVSIDGEFELIEKEEQNLFTVFEEHAFAQKNLNVEVIEHYLNSLFDETGKKAHLETLQREMSDYGHDLMTGSVEIEVRDVEWSIRDLLNGGLLSPAKRSTLRGLLESEAAIRELTDTLNAKSIRHWNWRDSTGGLRVVAQETVNGKYCVQGEEDIIDTLFLHCLAFRWSTWMKDCLWEFMSATDEDTETVSKRMQKREYYFQGFRAPQPTADSRCSTPDIPLSPPPLPSHMIPAVTPINRRERYGLPNRPPRKFRRSYGKHALHPRPPTPRHKVRRSYNRPPRYPVRHGPALTIDEDRHSFYMENFFLSRLPMSWAPIKGEKGTETQAYLLQALAMDIKTREAFDGSAHGISANFRSFASSMPHETILTVLKFFGVPDEWLKFFKRFLNAPLNMDPIGGDPDQMRTRTSGVPIGHAFESFFGEAVLFLLDLAIRHRTDPGDATPYLLRLRDECYFIGNEAQCEGVREQITNFSKAMGLDVSVKEMFAASDCPTTIGLVNFGRAKDRDIKSPGKVLFSLDESKVSKYAQDIKKQLSKCTSILAWASAWNRTIGTYPPHLFGPLNNTFGKAHADAVRCAYNTIYDVIMGQSNLALLITDLLPLPFPSSDLGLSCEAWIHLPTEFGGLGIKNPYASLCFDTKSLSDNPEAAFKDYLQKETLYYDRAKSLFENLKAKQKEDKLDGIFEGDEDRISAVLGSDWKETMHVFPTRKDCTANRERQSLLTHANRISLPYVYTSRYPQPGDDFPHTHEYNNYDKEDEAGPPPNPLDPYRFLRAFAAPEDVPASERIMDEVKRVDNRLKCAHWFRMSSQEKWALSLYGESCLSRFGGLELWVREWMPMELLKALRGEDDAESERV